MVKSVRLYIGNSTERSEELQYRYFREVNNPEDYSDLNIGERIVVNGIRNNPNPGQIIGVIKDVVNDPDHGFKSLFISLRAEDFKTAITSGLWTLI